MPDLTQRLEGALAGRYTIDRQIGEGGMATVFLAHDVKHKRPVALKVLKPELSALVGAERFLAEIETTANLQHPHILPLFDSGEADGLLFYVMPYIEGETLRQRLDRENQLPVEEGVRLIRAVASALDFAHRHGVVHRDIKPANILLQDGEPVVSDFGIALAVGAAGGSRLTETGLSVGTPFYMSPEQATGDQAIGASSDIYALAAVLYETLVGEPPYMGKTAQAVLGKILQGDPVSATTQRRSIPANVDAAIRKGLEKLPADRFATANDFAKALADQGFRHGAGTDAAVASPASRLRGWTGWAVAAVATAAFLWSVGSRSAPDGGVERFSIPMPNGAVFSGAATLLPDGSGMIYVAPSGDMGRMAWLRRWEDGEGAPIAGTEGAVAGRVSPDGTAFAFVDGGPGALKVAPLLGGAVRTLADEAWNATWSPDGRTVYYTGPDYGVRSLSVDEVQDPVQLVPGQRPDSGNVPAAFVPGRDVLLFRRFSTGSRGSSAIWALDLKSGESHVVVSATSVFVTPEGDLVYGTADGDLLAAPFDAKTASLSGPAAVIESGIATDAYVAPVAALSSEGSVLFQPGTQISSGTPVWVDRQGAYSAIDPAWKMDTNATYASVSLSPDGTRIAYSSAIPGPGRDLYTKRLPDGPSTRLQPVGTSQRRPTWSPNGSTLLFVGADAGGNALWTAPSDFSRAAELMLRDERGVLEGFRVADTDWVVFRAGTNTGGTRDNDIYAVRPGTDETPVPLVDTDGFDRQPTVSPNGRWLAYESNQSGRFEVYVRPFPETSAWRETVSVGGGTEPVWSRDGTELFYRSPTHLVAAAVSGRDRMQVTSRRALFEDAPFLRGAGHPMYDVAPDGRFVMIELGEATAAPAVFVKNWSKGVAAQLRR